jgi:hypothetical protein
MERILTTSWFLDRRSAGEATRRAPPRRMSAESSSGVAEECLPAGEDGKRLLAQSGQLLAGTLADPGAVDALLA